MSENTKNTPENMEGLLNSFDDLTLEETEILLEGINKVTLPPSEEIRLKTKILEKTGGYPIRVKNKKHMRRALLCIAAVMVCTIVADGASNLDGLQRFWGNDTEIYSKRTVETIQSVQNENIKFNIEGIVADKYQCVFVISIEALTKEGRKIINKNTDKHYILPLTIKRSFLSGDPNQGASGIFQYTDDNKNKDYKAYRCDFELKNVDLTEPVSIEFEGLSMNFDIPQSMGMITLYAGSAAASQSVDLSPIGYYYKPAGIDEDDPLSTEFGEVRLINEDGTLDEKLGYHGAMVRGENEEVMVIGSFTELIDLNDYLGIQIDGIKYTAK